MRALLLSLADVEEYRAMPPNAIAYGMARHGVKVKTPPSHNGRVMGPGSMIVPTLLACERRGWIAHSTREDGLTGSAYYLTQKGRQALQEIA